MTEETVPVFFTEFASSHSKNWQYLYPSTKGESMNDTCESFYGECKSTSSHKDIDMGYGEVTLWIHDSIYKQNVNPTEDDHVKMLFVRAEVDKSRDFWSFHWNRIYWGGDSISPVNVLLSRLSSLGEDKYTFTFKADLVYQILQSERQEAYEYLCVAKEDGDIELIDTAQYLYKRASRRVDMYDSDYDDDDSCDNDHHYVYNRSKKEKNSKKSSDKERLLSYEKEDRKARRQEKMKRYYY